MKKLVSILILATLLISFILPLYAQPLKIKNIQTIPFEKHLATFGVISLLSGLLFLGIANGKDDPDNTKYTLGVILTALGLTSVIVTINIYQQQTHCPTVTLIAKF